MTMMSNLVQNQIVHWFKPVMFYPNLAKYTFYSEGIVSFMPTSDGEVEKPTAPVCRLLCSVRLFVATCVSVNDTLLQGIRNGCVNLAKRGICDILPCALLGNASRIDVMLNCREITSDVRAYRGLNFVGLPSLGCRLRLGILVASTLNRQAPSKKG